MRARWEQSFFDSKSESKSELGIRFEMQIEKVSRIRFEEQGDGHALSGR